MTKQPVTHKDGLPRRPDFIGTPRNDLLMKVFMPKKQYYVYILANKTNVALYTGVTNDLKRRVYEHKECLVNGFAEKYGINRLVYYEIFNDPENAILREKQIKGGSRIKKNQLIESMNPEWKDLYDDI